MSIHGKSGLEEELFFRELDPNFLPSPPEPLFLEEAAVRERLAVKKNIQMLLEKYINLSRQPRPIHQLDLAQSSFDIDEFWAGIETMLGGNLTMGRHTRQFELDWSAWCGAAFSLMLNSGSSANLIALAAIADPSIEGHLMPGDEVIVPAIAWSTSVAPIVQMGAVPVFVDVDLDTFNLSVNEVKKALTPKTRAILPIHILGNPCDMRALQAICQERRLFLVEDCCEAHGAEVDGRKVGTWGDLGTFSFFFSHHITTAEGGMVTAQDRERWGDLLLSKRAHGWVRDRSDAEKWIGENPEIDKRWLFVTLGYNLRPTDINAAFGIEQLRKLSGYVAERRKIRDYWLSHLQERYGDCLSFQLEREGHSHSAFGFALVVKPEAHFSRKELQAHLEEHRVQTRPVISGNFTLQPVARGFEKRIVGELPNATLIHHHGLMVSNSPGISLSQRDYFLEVVEDFMRSRGLRG